MKANKDYWLYRFIFEKNSIENPETSPYLGTINNLTRTLHSPSQNAGFYKASISTMWKLVFVVELESNSSYFSLTDYTTGKRYKMQNIRTGSNHFFRCHVSHVTLNDILLLFLPINEEKNGSTK